MRAPAPTVLKPITVFADDGVHGNAAVEAGGQSVVFVRILHRKPSAWKTMPITPITGGKLTHSAIAVVPVHTFDAGDGGHVFSARSSGSVHLLDGWEHLPKSDIESLRLHARAWGDEVGEPATPHFALKSKADASDVVSRALHMLLQTRTIPGQTQTLRLRLEHDLTNTLRDLEVDGFVESWIEEGGSARWRLLQLGLEALLVCQKAPLAQRLCEVLPGKSLDEC